MTHAWTIAEREYQRHEARRGRRHAFERLEPATTALVVIDMVPFFAADNPHCRDAIEPINRLADALRRAGGVVAWVLPAAEDRHPELSCEFYGATVAEAYGRSGGAGALPDRLCPQLTHAPGDLFVEKSSPSAWVSCGHSRSGRAPAPPDRP